MKRLAPALALLLLACASGGPAVVATDPAAFSADERAAYAVVERLFEGMKAKDAAMLRSVFHPEARLMTTSGRDGQPQVGFLPADRFVESIAGATNSLEEPIFNPIVLVEANLATVWVDYTFLLDGQLSHCGVDAFQLARTAEGWKITQVADTRRTEGCESVGPRS